MEISRFLDYATLFFLQYIPNGLIYILAGYAFSAKVIDKKKYFFSSGILAVLGFTAKLISEIDILNTINTVPQILIIFACIFLLVYISKIKMVNAIIATLLVMILQLLFEGIYILLILKQIFNLDPQNFFAESVFKQSVLGLPNLIVIAILVYTFYNIMIKRRNNTGYAR